MNIMPRCHALNHGLCFRSICAAAQQLPCAGGRDDWPNAASSAHVRSNRLPGCRCRESYSCRPWQAGAAPPRRGTVSFFVRFMGELSFHHTVLMSHLFTEWFVCIARRGSPAASALRSVKRFAAARHVLVAAPRLVANSDNLIATTLMKGVMVNCGVSDDLVAAAPPLALPTVDFHLLWHRRTDQHPAHQWLRACIAEAAIH